MGSDTEPRFKVITGGRPSRDRDEDAGAALPHFEEALAKHLDRLFGFALRLERGNDAKAEDLVQETSLKAFRAYGSVRNAEALKSWFYRVLFNVFLDQQERRKREPSAQDAEWSQSLLEEPPGSDKDSPALGKP